MSRKKAKAGGMRQALEEVLVADPDDTTAHMAYADWLSEQDDPKDRARGEFVSVQLALADESRPAEQRKRLRKREGELLKAHQREWLGELAPFLLDGYELEDWAAIAAATRKEMTVTRPRCPSASADEDTSAGSALPPVR